MEGSCPVERQWLCLKAMKFRLWSHSTLFPFSRVKAGEVKYIWHSDGLQKSTDTNCLICTIVEILVPFALEKAGEVDEPSFVVCKFCVARCSS